MHCLFLFGTQDFGDWIMSPTGPKVYASPEEGVRIQSLKRCILNEKQDYG
jgi:hypothetical protein